MAKSEASIRVYLAPETKDRFKAACFHQGLNMSDIAAELIDRWLEENENSKPKEEVKPVSELFTGLIRQNYFPLMSSGKINHMRLKELAAGQKPSTKELQLIASILDFNPAELERLVS